MLLFSQETSLTGESHCDTVLHSPHPIGLTPFVLDETRVFQDSPKNIQFGEALKWNKLSKLQQKDTICEKLFRTIQLIMIMSNPNLRDQQILSKQRQR